MTQQGNRPPELFDRVREVELKLDELLRRRLPDTPPAPAAATPGSGFPIGPDDDTIGTATIERATAGSPTNGASFLLTTLKYSGDPTNRFISEAWSLIHDATGDPGDAMNYLLTAQSEATSYATLRLTSTNGPTTNGNEAELVVHPRAGSGLPGAHLLFDTDEAAGKTTVMLAGLAAAVEVTIAQTNDLLGFFGAVPVTQPATPAATAAGIIALLQTLGLCA